MQSWLYAISERINALEAVLDECEDKTIEPDVKNALATIYESDIPSAVSDGIAYIKRQESQVKAVDEEIKRLQALKKSYENRISRVKKGYTEFLTVVERGKVETSRGVMTVAAPTYKTEIDCIEDVPDEFKRATVKYDPDKNAIKQAILAGQKIPGAHLEQNQSIRIR